MIAFVRKYLVAKFLYNIQVNTQFATLHINTEMCNLMIKQKIEITMQNADYITNIAKTKAKVRKFAKKRAWAKVNSQLRKALI